MRCLKSKKLLPLLAGNDLSARKTSKLRAHLERCVSCRKEAGEYRSALNRIRTAARREAVPVWDGPEWDALMGRVAMEKAGRKSFVLTPRTRWAVASGVGVFIILCVLTLVFKDMVFEPKKIARASGPSIAQKEEPGVPAEGLPDIFTPEKEQIPVRELRVRIAGKQDPSTGVLGPELAATQGSQEILLVTLVSQETGLQVVWFFNKDFDWKGDEK